MKSTRLCFCIILLTWEITLVYCEEDDLTDAVSTIDFTVDIEDTNFVDPYSLDYDRTNKKMVAGQSIKFPGSEGVCLSDGQCRKELRQCKDTLANIEFDKIFTTRLINFLISTAKLKEKDDLLTGSITMSGTKAQIEELREFGNGQITMQQVDTILSNIIIPTTNMLEETLTWIDIVIYRYGTFSKAVLLTVVILLSIKFVNWSTGKVIIVFLAAGFLLSLFTIWSQLIKEAELKHLITKIKHKEPPVQCHPDKMSIWNRFVTYYYDDKDQCFEYYKSLEFDAFQEVTVIDAFVEVWDRLIVQPLARVGSAIGLFIENATKPLGYPMKWIVTILLYVLIPFLIFAIFGGRLRIWLTPFLGVSIGGGQESRNQPQLPPVIEQREPRIYVLERNSVGELRQLPATAVTQAVDDNKLAVGGGDSKTEKQEAKPKNSGAICASCCCKGNSRKSHVQEDEDVAIKLATSEVRSKEKGDGDCGTILNTS